MTKEYLTEGGCNLFNKVNEFVVRNGHGDFLNLVISSPYPQQTPCFFRVERIFLDNGSRTVFLGLFFIGMFSFPDKYGNGQGIG
jgi:hypothetical protein